MPLLASSPLAVSTAGYLDFVVALATGAGAGADGLAISQGNYVVHDQPVTDPLQLDLLNQFLAQIESAANDPYG